MYCTNCGSKVEDDWKVCPNCGKQLQSSSMSDSEEKKDINQTAENPSPPMWEATDKNTESPVRETTDKNTEPPVRETTDKNTESPVRETADKNTESPVRETTDKNAESPAPSTDFVIGQTKLTGRMLVRIFAILLIVCFFCPLYVVSCAGQELTTLNGPALAFGFNFGGETLDGNLIFSVLLFLPLCILACTCVTLKDTWTIQKYKNYGVAVSSCTQVLFIIYFTYGFQSALRELGLNMDIAPCIALRFMWMFGIASAIIGGYLAYLAEIGGDSATNQTPIVVKCIGKILGISIAIVALSMLLGNLLGMGVLDNSFSQDMMGIGNYDFDDDEEITQGSSETEDKNDEIQIPKDEDKDESVGNEEEDVEQISKNTKGLTGTYMDQESDMSLVIIQEGDKISYALYEKNGSAFQIEDDCSLEDGYINGKYYAITRNADGTLGVTSGAGGIWGRFEKVDDKAEIVRSEYVIEDSDKRYLSRDDVQGLTLQEINYAKNEIYARHGRKFQSIELQTYFNSKSWYKGLYEPNDFDQNYSGRVLNEFEKKNAEFLRDVEFSMNPDGYQLDK